jgi:uncharacterized RDD family membrane protein YckC
MGSAQLDILAIDQQAALAADAAPSELRQQVAQRLAAHRERRRAGQQESSPIPPDQRPRRNSIAAAVAERYAQTPSYRAFLAEQAQRAVEQAAAQAEAAAAEAEVAARNAQAIAAVQQELLAELELWTAPQQFTPETAETVELKPVPKPAARRPSPIANPIQQAPVAGLTVRLYQDFHQTPRNSAEHASTNAVPDPGPPDAEEFLALDEEIAFRQSPVAIRLSDPFTIEPPTPLPANLLEFPRQLVAARKARPRLAEGPLAEETLRSPQLRIFEVETEQISTSATTVSPIPEWASIHLDAHARSQAPAVLDPASPALMTPLPLPQAAPFQLRAMAVSVDFALIASAFLAFTAVATHIAQSVPTGMPALMSAAGVLVGLYLLYQILFFSFSEQTPGMRFARIGFCTMNDENPTRSAIRRRLLALGVAICPVGLGVLWAILDEDGLGWHDRISRMYPRSY